MGVRPRWPGILWGKIFLLYLYGSILLLRMPQIFFANDVRNDYEILSIASAITEVALSEGYDIREYFQKAGKQLERAFILDYDLDRIYMSLDSDVTPESEADIIIRTWNIGVRRNPDCVLVEWTFHCMGDAPDQQGSCSLADCSETDRILVFGKYSGLDAVVEDKDQLSRLEIAIHNGYGGLKDEYSRSMHRRRIAGWYTKLFQAKCNRADFCDFEESDEEMRVLTLVKDCYREVIGDEMLDTETILDYIKRYVTLTFQQKWSEVVRDDGSRNRFASFLRDYPTDVLLWLIREKALPESYERLAGLSGVVRISDDVSRIEKNAYKDCLNLEKIFIPDSVTEIKEGAFCGCVNLKEVRLSASIKAIPARAFFRCKNLVKISVPSSIDEIGDYAFSECEALTEIKLPGRLNRIGIGTFDGCSNLKDVSLPRNIKEIPAFAFARCECLSSVIIPDKVTEIGDYAFNHCVKMKELCFPNALQRIGRWALNGCSSLREVDMPVGLQEIGDGAFSGCSGVKEMRVPEGVNRIRTAAFMNCVNLRKVSFPNIINGVGKDIFLGCANLKEVSAPKGLDLSRTQLDGSVQIIER